MPDVINPHRPQTTTREELIARRARTDRDGMTDAQGRFVPTALIKPVDQARHALVCELADCAREHSQALSAFKVRALGDVQAFIDLSAEQYGVSLGGHKGNVTLYSFDGRYKLQRHIAEYLVFDERLQVAKQLIDECISEWAAGARDEIRALVTDAFQVNKQGKISTQRVLGLRRLDIHHGTWDQAMRAITDSITIAGSRTYLRIYERVGETDQYVPISLDIAAL